MTEIPPAPSKPPRKRRARRILRAGLLLVGLWLALAYVVLPRAWLFGETRYGLAETMRTTTTAGIPGDPVNLVFVGDRETVLKAFDAIGWDPADPVTISSSVEIGISVVLDRPYPDAPVSTLLYEGKPQTFAFEKAVGGSADRRHHVRLWQSGRVADDGSPVYVGAASFDRGAGLSHDTGAVTHHIAPDVDAERDLVVERMEDAGLVQRSYAIDGMGATWEGRNGGGDLFFTDGSAAVILLNPAATPK